MDKRDSGDIEFLETSQGADRAYSLVNLQDSVFEEANKLVMCAEELWDNNRIVEAAQMFEEALNLDPMNADVWFNYGVLLRRAERFEESLLALHRSNQLEPGLGDTHYTTGNVYRSMGRLKDAARSYQRCLDFSPTNTEAANNLAITLLEMDQPEEAEAILRNSLVTDPRDPNLHRNLGVVLFELNRVVEAVFALRRAVDLDSSYADAWAWLGDAYASLGLHGAAVEAQMKADIEGISYPIPDVECSEPHFFSSWEADYELPIWGDERTED